MFLFMHKFDVFSFHSPSFQSQLSTPNSMHRAYQRANPWRRSTYQNKRCTIQMAIWIQIYANVMFELGVFNASVFSIFAQSITFSVVKIKLGFFTNFQCKNNRFLTIKKSNAYFEFGIFCCNDAVCLQMALRYGRVMNAPASNAQ